MKIKRLNENVLNTKQQQVIDDFIVSKGGIDIKTYKETTQLLLDKNMILMEGLTYEWIEFLKKEFKHLTIGIPEDNTKYGMYISLTNF